MAEYLDSLGIKQAADVSKSDPAAEFTRVISSAASLLSNRGVVAQPDDGSKSQCLSEYAVFARYGHHVSIPARECRRSRSCRYPALTCCSVRSQVANNGRQKPSLSKDFVQLRV
eukprot:SAG31_NODE_705_length_12695_cov_3.147007_2_plen_114_part_00